MSFDADLVTRIAAQVGALTAGTNLFAGPVRAFDPQATTGGAEHIPAQCVFVILDTGDDPRASLSTKWINFPRAVIRTRSNPNEYTEGLALSRLVRQAVHAAAIAGYIDVLTEGSEPGYLGDTDNALSEWVIRVGGQIEVTI